MKANSNTENITGKLSGKSADILEFCWVVITAIVKRTETSGVLRRMA